MFVSGKSHHKLLELHNKYGATVRLGPSELSYIAPQAWEDIMGRHKPGQRSENAKAPWYEYCNPKNKDIIGAPREDHARMRRLLANGFSASATIEQQPLIKGYVDLLILRLRGKAKNGKRILRCVQILRPQHFPHDGTGGLQLEPREKCVCKVRPYE